MAIDNRHLQYGEPLYDRAEQTSVVLIDPARPRVRDLDEKTRKLVLEAEGNKMLGVGPDSQTVDVAYIDADRPSTRSYTIPTTRLAAPDVTDLTDGLTPTELTKAYYLHDLAVENFHTPSDSAETSGVFALAERAGTPDHVIEYAETLLEAGDE